MKDLNLSGREKAMIFLSALGDEASSSVLKYLPENIAHKISEELNFFPKPNQEMVAYVFKELSKQALAPAPAERSAMADRIAAQLTEQQRPQAQAPIDPLEALEPSELLRRLQNEQVQTIAYVLSLISDVSREKFYELLSPGRRTELQNVPVADIPFQTTLKPEIIAALTAPRPVG